MEKGEFAELSKNTVTAKEQLKETEFVTFENAENTGLRVLFLGNSITRHAPKADIGWHFDHGMAASEKEKDYVHLLMVRIKKQDPNAAFCLCQGAAWERCYQNGSKTYDLFSSARDFGADIIVMRLTENCPYQAFDGDIFARELSAFLTYLDPTGKAKRLYTTSFWRHPADTATRALAKKEHAPLIELSDLGEKPEMKALGLFEHNGVANHPGDLGMEHIAARIGEKLDEILLNFQKND